MSAINVPVFKGTTNPPDELVEITDQEREKIKHDADLIASNPENYVEANVKNLREQDKKVAKKIKRPLDRTGYPKTRIMSEENLIHRDAEEKQMKEEKLKREDPERNAEGNPDSTSPVVPSSPAMPSAPVTTTLDPLSSFLLNMMFVMLFYFVATMIFTFYGIGTEVYGIYFTFYLFLYITTMILPTEYAKIKIYKIKKLL